MDKRKLLARGILGGGGSAWADVSIPHANFSWIPFTVQKNGRAFRPAPTFELSSLIDQTGGDRYVGKGGNDSADGLTYATRWLTIGKAYTSTPANGRVLVYAGKYAWFTEIGGNWVTKNLSLIGMEAGVYLDGYFSQGAWSLTSGKTFTYQTAWSGIGNPSYVVDYGTLLSDGAPTSYVLKTSVDEVEAQAGTYYYASNVLYVRPLEAGSPDSDVRQFYAGGKLVSIAADNRKAYIENITTCGLSSLINNASATGGTAAYFKDCKIFYPNLQAFVFNGADGVFQNCTIAYDTNGRDLIGGFAANTVTCKIIEIDCTAHDIGNGVGTQSWNCTTNHNAGKNLIINGEYYNSYGHPIGFINEGEAWMLGTYAHTSLSTEAANNANYQLDLSLCYMDCCQGDGSTKGFTPSDTTIYGRSFVGDLTSTAGGSVTMTPY